MKRADDTTRLLVKAALIQREVPFLSLSEAAKMVLAGRDVEKARSKEPAVAHVSEGTWYGECPAPGCRGAEKVDEQHDMLCGSCGTVSKVAWPKNIKEIERLLSKRDVWNQHWLPHETVAELLAQNIEHGIWENE